MALQMFMHLPALSVCTHARARIIFKLPASSMKSFWNLANPQMRPSVERYYLSVRLNRKTNNLVPRSLRFKNAHSLNRRASSRRRAFKFTHVCSATYPFHYIYIEPIKHQRCAINQNATLRCKCLLTSTLRRVINLS